MSRLPDDAARYAWVVLLCAAAETNGQFESEEHVQMLIGKQYIKHLPAFRRAGLLDGLLIHDWEEWNDLPQEELEERKRKAATYRKRAETLGITADAPVRTMREWYDYVINGPTDSAKIGRLGEYWQAMMGVSMDREQYIRLAMILKASDKQYGPMMVKIADISMRQLSGDALSYLQKAMAAPKNRVRSAGIRATVSRDQYVEE